MQVTEAVLSDRWADAVEAEEADAKASKFARWFNKTEGTHESGSQSSTSGVVFDSVLFAFRSQPFGGFSSLPYLS